MGTMDVLKRFLPDVVSQMQNDVIEAGGNEVFWSCKIDHEGMIVIAKVGARGNEDSVIVNPNAAREGHVLVHNHPSGVLEPSNADQNIAFNAVDSSLGFYIVDNSIKNVYVVVEPVKPRVLEKLDVEQTAGLLGMNGPLAKKDEFYEERPSQIELVKNVAIAMNENKVGVFEAGTGVGKSFAYLIPSVLWAGKNKERVVVSTGTINLQQQLIEKDIPKALEITGQKVKAVLVKGRQNYICLRRLDDARRENEQFDLFNQDAEIFESISKWADTTETGSRSDLSFMPPENVWSRVNSESDACMGGRCRYRENCFVMKVRKEASDANLIVVNHHLLFSDIESRMNGAGYDDVAVLPPYKHLVFDEAHGIEESATSFFSETINRFRLTKQLNLLYRYQRSSVAGLIVQLSVVVKARDFLDKAAEYMEEIRIALATLDQTAVDLMENYYNLRIHQQNAAVFVQILTQMEKLRESLGIFTGYVRDNMDELDDEDKDLKAVWETKTVIRRLESYVTLCGNYCSWNEHEDTVFWMEKKKLPARKAGDVETVFVEFNQTPLNISPLMNKGVFEPLDSICCVSATLRTGTSFNYWSNRSGVNHVDPDRLLQNVFESPFPYKTNVLFGVPSDAPSPVSPMFQDYIEHTVPRLILAAGGKTLVLFTSYDSLRHTYSACQMQIIQAGYTLLKQGDDDRFRLLERFKEDTNSILFATDSFWEGVDIPGESLSQVIIVKLPFAVPNDPVFEARSQAVEERGGSSFMELSVPQAVIKFRQGFGRLMRRSTDKGIIIVLDRRIVEKPYGRQFTTSVPMSRRMYNPLDQIVSAVEKFL